jgi:enoyl-CoA hydratase/carnithine racemase/carbon monoxide dehydrogenase subunit G
MELKDEIRLDASREAVWAALNDPEVLKACIPGCESLERVSETEFTSLVVVKVGPIKAKFNGKVTLCDIVAPSSYRLVGEGQGGVAGFAKSDITVELVPEGSGATLLRYGVTANIGGKIAQLGSRLIDSTARKMAEQFFGKFNEILCPAAEESPGTVTEGATTVLPSGLASGDHLVVTLIDLTEPVASGDDGAAPAHAGGWFSRLIGRSQDSNSGSASGKPPAGNQDVGATSGSATHHKAAVVTLNRASQRNAVSLAMWRDLATLFTELGARPEIRAIFLTGAGGCFSAGADISEFGEVRATVAQGEAYERAVDACCDAIAATPKPTVAVIDGYCMGGACHLAMACDFRWARTDAQFGIPAARLSVVYGVRGVQRLLALVGLAQTRHIMFSAAVFDAAQAQRIGFVDGVAEQPMAAALAYAAQLANNAPLTIAGTKTMLNGLTMDMGLLSAQVVDEVVNRAVASDDYRDARQAFVEKRAPVFTGK